MSASIKVPVVLVSHGGAAEAMLEAAERVVGAMDGVAAVTVGQGEVPAAVEKRLEEAVARLGGGDRGVLFLVDLGGSTPFNLCCRSCGGHNAVVTGMNLPMLFKLATVDRARRPSEIAE